MATKKEKYIVLKKFLDLQDNNKVYEVGERFPKPANKKVSEERLNELLGSDNRQGTPLIEKEEK
ncbi:hypothetical protein KEI82_002440 [Staphylococcus pseudintermedius]|uniref:hypothetical protein n=1 Tax=Staphylococcus pseudintermedius TaxID=283734 RepID=UPI0018F72B0E|nr:hypothetical protein [Staphylococcus pseudintermedius]EGQ3068541.1 hypothetical protein [Staphylococcus pseudintermedius]EGQ3151775.1 hypothetical protein [Staphylococcus pseudintermedius]EGQ3871467.1 hypothetical protein [Staphylococcus pseudintermedius]EHL7209584.1 hypothetical protein [Staphylococcus pseudintermedius]EIM5218842.1 hypothetical protein [Staphylococcus pseudintermedius]